MFENYGFFLRKTSKNLLFYYKKPLIYGFPHRIAIQKSVRFSNIDLVSCTTHDKKHKVIYLQVVF